jgi:hypothetical protein
MSIFLIAVEGREAHGSQDVATIFLGGRQVQQVTIVQLCPAEKRRCVFWSGVVEMGMDD